MSSGPSICKDVNYEAANEPVRYSQHHGHIHTKHETRRRLGVQRFVSSVSSLQTCYHYIQRPSAAYIWLVFTPMLQQRSTVDEKLQLFHRYDYLHVKRETMSHTVEFVRMLGVMCTNADQITIVQGSRFKLTDPLLF